MATEQQPFDWAKHRSGGAMRPDSFSGMNGEFRTSLETMFQNAPEDIRAELSVFSGYRSPEKQAQLWQDALKKYGSAEAARKWVAPPGKSYHNKGGAADMKFASDRAKKWVHDNAARFGLAFPLSNEDWHIELASGRSGGTPSTPNTHGTEAPAGFMGIQAQYDPSGHEGHETPEDEAARERKALFSALSNPTGAGQQDPLEIYARVAGTGGPLFGGGQS